MTAHGTNKKREHIFPLGHAITEEVSTIPGITFGTWTVKTCRFGEYFCEFAIATLQGSKVGQRYMVAYHQRPKTVGRSSLTIFDYSTLASAGVDEMVKSQQFVDDSIFSGNIISPADSESELVTLPEAWTTAFKAVLKACNITYQREVSFALYSAAQECCNEFYNYKDNGVIAHPEDAHL